jgi:hypothetical protein
MSHDLDVAICRSLVEHAEYSNLTASRHGKLYGVLRHSE